MKRTEPQSVGEIIREGFRRAGMTSMVAQQRACYLGPEIVGPGINRYTFKRYVDNGVLHVYMTSSVLKNELSFNRSALVEQINRAVGEQAITSIIFH